MGCGKLHFKCICDKVIKQGSEFDLRDGITAYDANGNEIPFEVEPEELDTCVVGLHKIQYTAFGEDSSMKPYLRLPKKQRDIHVVDFCDLKMLKAERQIFVTQAMPPRLIGVDRASVRVDATFDPMYGVSAIDDNGNEVEVTYSGVYDNYAEGNPATFETDLERPLKSVKVTIEPSQDGTPWMADTLETAPCLFRRSADGKINHSYNSEMDKIVGATMAWNQLRENGGFYDTSAWSVVNVSMSVASNVATLVPNGTKTGTLNYGLRGYSTFTAKHKYLFTMTIRSTQTDKYRGRWGNQFIWSDTVPANTWATVNAIITADSVDGNSNIFAIYAYDDTKYTTNDTIQLKNVVGIDLTQDLGSVIADYVYSLEQATAGSGIAWLKKYGFIDDSYHAYNAGELMSVKTSAHRMVGFNQWDEEWEVGTINADGSNYVSSINIRSKNYIPVIGNTTYYIKSPFSAGIQIFEYDSEKNYISRTFVANTTITLKSNTKYIRFRTPDGATTYNNDICINFSDPQKNGTYEPYEEHSYPLDSNLELRGIFKLNSNNEPYADGDTYEPSGKVTRRFKVVDLGDLGWSQYTDSSGDTPKYCYLSGDLSGINVAIGGVGIIPDIISDKYTTVSASGSVGSLISKGNNVISTNTANKIFIWDTNNYTTASAFRTAVTGLKVICKLATPTTEQATPFASPQWVDPLGTEEYIDTRDVKVPVGHSTRYADIYAINGTSEVNVSHLSGNLFGGEALRDGLLNAMPTATDNAGERYVSFFAGSDGVQPVTEGFTFKENTQYTFIYQMWKGTGSGSGLRLYYTDSTHANLPSPHEEHEIRKVIFTSAENKTIDRIEIRHDGSSVNIYYDQSGIFEGVIDSTDFEYYQKDVYNVDFSGESFAPVYGGTVDVATGEVVVTRVGVDLGTLNYGYSSADKRFYTTQLQIKNPPNVNVALDAKSSLFKAVSLTSFVQDMTVDGTMAINGSYFFIRSLEYSNATDFKNSVRGIQLVYPLAEPITYHIDPTVINSLIGVNNIGTDAVEVWVRFEKSIPSEGSFQYPLEGTYEIVYEAEDHCGNVGTAVREINVIA